MTVIESGVKPDGTPCRYYMHDLLSQTLDRAQARNEKNWDYVAIVAGLPGAGKSTFSMGCARYLDTAFSNARIAFTADEFIDITSNCPMYSSVVLDESFETLNSNVSRSPEFLRIVSHLQLIRKRRLKIFLNLPNFFDLSSGIAIFRASHLFLVYGDDEGNRGDFLAFDRDAKRLLYIKGKRFIDYNSHPANFRGSFVNSHCIDEAAYERMKDANIENQKKVKEKTEARDNLIRYCHKVLGVSYTTIAVQTGLNERSIQNICSR